MKFSKLLIASSLALLVGCSNEVPSKELEKIEDGQYVISDVTYRIDIENYLIQIPQYGFLVTEKIQYDLNNTIKNAIILEVKDEKEVLHLNRLTDIKVGYYQYSKATAREARQTKIIPIEKSDWFKE